MKQITKRIIASILTMVMMLGNVPTIAFANEVITEANLVIESVNKINSTDLFKDITDMQDLAKRQGNQRQVTYVNYKDGVITVNANIANMQEVESTADVGIHKFFAIMVNFEDVSVLKTDGIFSDVDVRDAYQCGGTESKSAILWINGSSREGRGTTVTELPLKHKNKTDTLDITLVVNDTSSPAIRDVSKIEASDMFAERKDAEYGDGYEAKVKKMQANQEYVDSVEYNVIEKTITVNANISRMEPIQSTTIGGEAKKYFAVMVDFYNVKKLETGADKVFAECDVTDAKDCAKENQEAGNSAILWIDGSKEEKTRTITLKTKGSENNIVAQYTLVLNEVDEAVEINGASKITEGSEAIKINQEHIDLVKWEPTTSTITVNADISKMVTSTSTTDNTQPKNNKYFAIMVDFKDVNLLKTGDVFAECDIQAAKELGKENSAILWINGTTKELCSGVEGETNYSINNDKTLELVSKDGDAKSTIKLVVNETGKGIKINGAYDIDEADLFAERTDSHVEEMRANQKYVESVNFQDNTIIVNADMSEMKPIVSDTIGGEAKKYFAIMVDFLDINVLKIDGGEPFATCDVEAASQCKSQYQNVDNSAILWINGSSRTEDVNETDLKLVSTDDGKTYTYKLVVREVTYPVEITGASKIKSEDMFYERNDEHAIDMRYNQDYVNSVVFNSEENIINVEVDINGLKDIVSPTAGTKKWFAVMIDFKDVSILKAGEGEIFETKDITDANLCNGGANSAILWISASGGTRDIPLTLVNKNTNDEVIYTVKLVNHKHDMEHFEEVPAECMTEGKEEYYVCKNENCGRIYKDAEGLNETTHDELSIVKLHDSLPLVEEKEATCTTDGKKEHYHCNKCNKSYKEYNGITEIPEEELIIKGKHGNLTRVPGTEAKCEHKGNVEYYICEECEGYVVKKGNVYVDVTEEQVLIEAKGHDIKEVPEKEATCKNEGNVQHYKCTRCNEVYYDQDGEYIIPAAEVMLVKKEHSINAVPAVAATCNKPGNVAHYRCSMCQDLYKDASGKLTTTAAEVTIAAHTRTKVSGKAATYLSTGIKAYYKCSCGKLYSDATGTKTVTASSLVTPKLVLGKTSKVAIGSRKQNSLKLAWYKVPGATGYRVFVKKSGKWVTIKTLTGTSYTATKLVAGTNYTFAVRAYVKQSGKTIWAPSYATKSGYTRPSKAKVVVKARAKTSVNLTWSNVKGATGYRVYVKQGKKWKTLKTTTGRSFTVTKLKRKSSYTFAVKAYTKEGSTVVWSDVYTTKSAKTR